MRRRIEARSAGERYSSSRSRWSRSRIRYLETKLRAPSDARQFVLHYQPQIDLASGAVCGLETSSLAGSEKGSSAGAFIPPSKKPD